MSNTRTTGIDFLLDLNERHSRAFMDVSSERRRYRGEHPTEIAALKCIWMADCTYR